jgi:chemotaxis protein histidine kinase CheA
MRSLDFERLQLDVADLIEQIRHHRKTNQGSTQQLTRHTHSLKSLALQTGNTIAANLIHQIEGELLVATPSQLSGSMDQLLNQLHQSFLSGKSNNDIDNIDHLDFQKVDQVLESGPTSTQEISASEIIAFFKEEHWNLALYKTAKHLTCYSLVFQIVDSVDEDLVTVRIDQILQKYAQLGSIFFNTLVANRFLIGLLTEYLHVFPQRVPQVQLIEAKNFSHQELLQSKVKVKNGFIETSNQTSDLMREIQEFVTIETTRQNKQVKCSIFGTLEYNPHIIDTIKGVIFQAIRNSITHGIHTPFDRTKLGKKSIGLIEITFFKSLDTYVITIEDDGEGFDPSLVHSIPKQPKNRDFNSGRNLGLGMMRWYIEQLLGGRFLLESKPSLGTKITIELCASLHIHEGVSVLIQNTGCFIKLENLYCLIDSIESLHPSRLGSYWYGTMYGKNYPLFELSNQSHSDHNQQPNKFDLKTLEMYTPEVQKGKGILFRYKDQLGILIAVDTIARERIVQKILTKDMFSQAFEIPVVLLE